MRSSKLDEERRSFGRTNTPIAEIVGWNLVAVLDDEAHRRSRGMKEPDYQAAVDAVRSTIT